MVGRLRGGGGGKDEVRQKKKLNIIKDRGKGDRYGVRGVRAIDLDKDIFKYNILLRCRGRARAFNNNYINIINAYNNKRKKQSRNKIIKIIIQRKQKDSKVN